MDRREVLRRVAFIMGGAVSAPTISAFLSGCQRSEETTVELLSLSPDQYKRVSVIAEHIIPATDTPGANDVGVPQFIDTMLHHCYEEEERNAFLQGVDQLEKDAEEKYGNSFVDLNEEEQLEMLKAYQTEALAQKKPGPSPVFIRTMRELTLLGYFTSEPGANQTLEYVAVPGRYEGCIPLEANQKTWAT